MAEDKQSVKIALVQMNAGLDVAKNLQFLKSKIEIAKQDGADYILTPENSLLMDLNVKRVTSIVAGDEYQQAIKDLQELALKHQIFLHIGSIAVLLEGNERPQLANRSMLFGPDGDLLATYDKIHMFDVNLPNGESYRESSAYRSGERGVIVDCTFAKIGMTICYDLRFPHLYRSLAKNGANIISVPAAFTKQTGEAHWHILLRARAIETGCFIIAAAQTGQHDNGRQTYGHSLVIGPWGDVLLDAKSEPGVYLTEIDLGKSDQARSAIPSLLNDQTFKFDQQ